MSLFEDDLDAIRRQERQVQEQAERARVMRQRIEAVQGVGTSADERVEVVVDSGGTLLGIDHGRLRGRPTRRRRAGHQRLAGSFW